MSAWPATPGVVLRSASTPIAVLLSEVFAESAFGPTAVFSTPSMLLVRAFPPYCVGAHSHQTPLARCARKFGHEQAANERNSPDHVSPNRQANRGSRSSRLFAVRMLVSRNSECGTVSRTAQRPISEYTIEETLSVQGRGELSACAEFLEHLAKGRVYEATSGSYNGDNWIGVRHGAPC